MWSVLWAERERRCEEEAMGSIIQRGYEALRTEPSVVAWALTAACTQHGWDEARLAAWLGIEPEWLPALGLFRRPQPSDPGFTDHVATLAQAAGCDYARLLTLLNPG
jgi:hypothetical protein